MKTSSEYDRLITGPGLAAVLTAEGRYVALDLAKPLIEQVVGYRIYGGCIDCDAYQEFSEVEPRIFKMSVIHDDWCPLWKKQQGKQKKAKR